jgi:putative tryptophan/tyrosine transport system substrate-binding protein
MKRRAFIAGIGATTLWPRRGLAQNQPVVGFLRHGSQAGSEHLVAGLHKGLAQSGFAEGKNVAFKNVFSDGRSERLPALAAELVRHPVDVIMGSTINAALAAKAATSTIPIVFVIANDAVAAGLVTSLNRPGGNLTGVSYLTSELGGKRLGLMREVVPNVTRYAVIINPSTANSAVFVRDAEAAARSANLEIEVFHASKDVEIDAAFEAVAQRRLGAVLVANDPLFTTHRSRITGLASRYRLPAIYTTRELAHAGGLLSYGSNLADAYRLAGDYVGRILKGDKPMELPVLQPVTFEMVVNLQTAKALGLEIPPMLLARADEVIE